MKNNYSWVRWDEKKLEENKKKFLDEINENLKKIKNIKKEDRTYENTILALEYLSNENINFPHFVSLLFSVSPKENIRNKCLEIEQEIENKVESLTRDRKIYQAILEYKENKEKNKEKLKDEDEKLFQDLLKKYQRMGFDLKGEKENEYKKNLKRLTKLSTQFRKNINDYEDFIEVEEKDLEDLPENFRKTLKKNKKGKYEISIIPSQSSVFLSYSANEEKRKELSIKISKKGGEKNLKILKEILELRDRNAKLLGYKNHAEYILEDRMAKSPEVVEKFEWDLVKKVQKKAEKEEKELLDFKLKYENLKKGKIRFYDGAYYSRKLQEKKYSISAEKNREYFELENTKKEMFQIFGDLFSVEFRKNKQKLWYKDVELFEIFDKKNQEKIGEIAFDLFPRKGKYGHAMAHPIFIGMEDPKTKKYITPSTAVVCNFRPATKNIPSLLSLGDVSTLFHEFGHAIHNSLTKAKYPSQSGFSVKWDFVEVPSQLLENWLKDKKVLKKISKHYLTGKRMPEKMIENNLKAEKFMMASGILRQLIFGIFDFDLHTKKIKNPEKYYQSLNKKIIKNIDINKESLFPASFGHLMGYDAGYYSYMWALVMAEDIFSEFKKAGILNKKIGQKYRKEILEVGSSRDELESVEKFLGRKTNNRAFLERLEG